MAIRSPLDIVLLTTTYRPDPLGISIYATEIAEHLAERGDRVRVVTSLPHYPQWEIRSDYRGMHKRVEDHNGVEVTRLWLYVPKTQSAVSRAVYEGSFLFHGLAAYRPGRLDLVLSMIPSVANGVLGAWWSTRSGAPHVMFVQDLSGNGAHEAGLRGGSAVAGLVSRAEVALARRARVVTVCSDGFRASLERGGVSPDHLVDFPNWCQLGEPTSPPEETRRRLGWRPDERIVLHAGNMGMKQGLELIASYARQAATSAPELRFVLLGDGSQRPLVERNTRGLANVTLLRPVPESQLPDVLAAADVLFVHERPSLREMSIPSKLTAYFSAGRPVVAAVTADGLTARDIERSGGGIVVENGNPASVVAGLQSVTIDQAHARAMAAAGREYAHTHYSRGAAMNRLDGIVDRALRDR